MSKTAVKKLHWRSNVQDSFVPLLGSSGDLGIAAGGGADYGEFPFVTSAPGGGLTVGDIILEIGGTPVLGMTLGDVRGVLNSCPHPIRIKTVSPGFTLCKDLRLYLSKCFTPGSVDSQLQQVIRENLYLRAVPCTTRQPRDGEIPGVDYNFVSIEEFFSLEESGALLESGKFKGNYYGTPRPIHVSADSPPITYQEHRNLLRNYRTRSKSLSNLEKAAEDGPNGEEDSGQIRGSHRRPRASSSGDERAVENRATGGKRGARLRGLVPDRWELAFSDPGEPHFIEVHRSARGAQGFPRARTLDKGPQRIWFQYSWRQQTGRIPPGVQRDDRRTFEPEDSQTHKLTSPGAATHGRGGPGGRVDPAVMEPCLCPLALADVLVYVNEVCVLGVSHREVVEMLQVVPVGRGVDVEVKRGYPLLYTYDGCLRLPDGGDPTLLPTTTTTSQPQPRLPTPTHHSLHFDFGEVHGDGRCAEPGPTLDADGDLAPLVTRQPPPYRRLSVNAAFSPPPARHPRSLRGLARLQSLDPTLASQSDSEVVSAVGSHRPQASRLRTPSTPDSPHHRHLNGFHTSPTGSPNAASSPGGSTSFLESIPVTLTMEPKDWISTGLEDEAGATPFPHSALERRGSLRSGPLRGFDVELRRKPGEGFGFVIASQDVKNGKAASLLPHRFVTVRRGSPAAKSGQIRAGDRLEAVEGRSVVSLPHRELAQILRRAGNTLRLTIIPRPSTCKRAPEPPPSALRSPLNPPLPPPDSSSLSEPECDTAHRSRKGQRSRPKERSELLLLAHCSLVSQRDSRYYSVDLDRGPSGFGFSLRGGSEYNMGLYVLGLMEGGPASRSQKMEVSDQLVEINGNSTAGMTHSQAVEQIRRGGHRIHLVLKRGNGYVPDYGRERKNASPSRLHHPKEQGVAAVDPAGQKRSSAKLKKRRSRSSTGHVTEKRTGRRHGVSEVAGRADLQSPTSEAGEEGSQEAKGKRRSRSRSRRSRRRKQQTQSLPRDSLRNDGESGTEEETVRERESRRRPRKSRSVGSVRRRGSEEEEEQDGEDGVEREQERREEVEEKEWSEDDVFLPVPSPVQRVPRPKHNKEEEEKDWEVEKNHGEVERNHWEVEKNHGEVERNHGEVERNHWEVEKNHGEVERNHWEVERNHWKVEKNHGEVERNHWEVERNHGEVERNHGEVERNHWEVAAEYREMRGEEVESWENEGGETEVAEAGGRRPFPGASARVDPGPENRPFSFLAATSVEQQDSDSGGSQSDVSMSAAASISGLSLAASVQADGGGARTLPGPWLRPGQREGAKLREAADWAAFFLEESRQTDGLSPAFTPPLEALAAVTEAQQGRRAPASLLPHRFVTVRRGSPAAKSGQIRAGDRLEAVEGRSVVSLPHRELAQILRRAGNTLRLTIIPRPSTYSSSLSEPECDTAHRSRKGQRSRPKERSELLLLAHCSLVSQRDSRYYSVDLDRGPSGFGFSLRGGSEYNMGLYVLGLMEGGPASRSQKMEVSDQLVEINGNSTAGMTHSQAVEQIRRGGHRIHLVLKRGNGYVPDYGRERKNASPSRLHHPKEQGVAAVDPAGQKRSSAKLKKRRSRSSTGHVTEKRTGRRHGVSEVAGRADLQSPTSEAGEEGSQEAKGKRRSRSRSRRSRRRKQQTQSLPRDSLRNDGESGTEEETVRERESRRRPRKSRSVGSVRRRGSEEEEEQDGEDGVEREQERREEVEEKEWSEDDVFLPVPSPVQRVPRPKHKEEEEEKDWEVEKNHGEVERNHWEVEKNHGEVERNHWEVERNHGEVERNHGEVERNHWEVAAEYREMRGEEVESWENEGGETEVAEAGGRRPFPGASARVDPGPENRPFSFLAATSVEQQDSDSGGSQSDVSMSAAASISGLSLAASVQADGGGARTLPGPWLRPGQREGAKVAEAALS
ncbi:unnamed protein product [Tetraodon nigroviridis]|uniref:(spotted green pufferfish) hypothetical protein n=1 Tax=Tetraodon nigroviridis TaxID=99883 RepID=Q4S5Z7_TETNG|nr:unnamed protein product [Tetraodon nigroviridis]